MPRSIHVFIAIFTAQLAARDLKVRYRRRPPTLNAQEIAPLFKY